MTSSAGAAAIITVQRHLCDARCHLPNRVLPIGARGTCGPDVNFRKIIKKHIRHSGEDVDVDADINAVIAANVGTGGETTAASSRQRVAYRSHTRAHASDEEPLDGVDENDRQGDARRRPARSEKQDEKGGN